MFDAATYRPYKKELIERVAGVAAFSLSQSSMISSIPKESSIVGVGIGAKLSGGVIAADEIALRVYVRAKRLSNEIPDSEKIPKTINGLDTDVIAVGDIVANAISCGNSVGHEAVSAGTLGCLVKRIEQEPSKLYILSNNHVLAANNEAQLNDNILQPGPADGGKLPSFAQLTQFRALDFTGPNLIDAAIAQVNEENSVNPEISKIGRVKNPPVDAQLYQSVRKHGRTTLHTVGVILGLAEDINVRYGNKVASFEDQLAIVGVGSSLFSQGGDSGSLIVDAVSLNPVALLFAGGGDHTFANPIQLVLSEFNAEIV